MLTDGDTPFLMRSDPTDLIESASGALPVLEQAAQSERPSLVKVIARQCWLKPSAA